MRCASPPESVDDSRSSVKYSRPTSHRKPSRRSDLPQHLGGHRGFLLGEPELPEESCAWRTVSAETASIVRPTNAERPVLRDAAASRRNRGTAR